MQAKYRKVTWFAENVACPEFVEAMKGLFPEATFVVLNHASSVPNNGSVRILQRISSTWPPWKG